MFQTSGISSEGICPSMDDGELLDELKPLYKNGFHLSKKRLAVGYQFGLFYFVLMILSNTNLCISRYPDTPVQWLFNEIGNTKSSIV